MPGPVRRIIDRLEENGFEAYAVGGCVRDACLGREPHDWDITTNASPVQIKTLFRRTVDTGIAHGTVTVMDGKEGYEVTTYRIDGTYEDARHPSSVTFTPNLREDLRRRDFTINAMAYNDSQGLVDLFGGQGDLENGLIRCVGDPEERFGEDALRILRAIRFAAQLGFAVEEETAHSAGALAQNLTKISAERIRDELMKLLVSNRPQTLCLAWQLGITSVILPEFDRIMAQQQTGPHHILTVGEHTLVALTKVEAEPVLRLTMLLHDMGKPSCGYCDDQSIWHFPGHAQLGAQMADTITRRLKFDRETMKRTHSLIAMHSQMPEANPISVRQMASQAGKANFCNFLKVKRADILAQREDASQAQRLSMLDEVERIWTQVMASGDPLTVADLAIHGNDLIRLGIKPGRDLGRILQQLLAHVLIDPALNDADTLLALAQENR